MKLYPVDDVWGIGRRYAAKLESLGIHTAYEFASMSKEALNATFNNIVIYRTWAELNGEDCVPNEAMAKKKSICTSRSFNGMISDLETIKIHVANYAARCAEKLRQQNTVASIVGVFLNTNYFRDDLPQYWQFKEVILLNTLYNNVKGKLWQYNLLGLANMGLKSSSLRQKGVCKSFFEMYNFFYYNR